MSSLSIFFYLSYQSCHEFKESLPVRDRYLYLAEGIGAEADPVREEDFFESPGFIGLEGGNPKLFPGITGFGISDPENKAVAIPVQEFISFGGLGDDVNVTELKFLNLLHIESI